MNSLKILFLLGIQPVKIVLAVKLSNSLSTSLFERNKSQLYSTFRLTIRILSLYSSIMNELENNVRLSNLLKAVSDTTRRSLLTLLIQQGPTRVTDLANFYDMSLNAVSKHIKVLEKVGLVTRTNHGRVHWIEANLEPVQIIEDWFKELKSIWELRLDNLNTLLNKGE